MVIKAVEFEPKITYGTEDVLRVLHGINSDGRARAGKMAGR